MNVPAKRVCAAVALVLLLATVFAPVRHFEFVSFDDLDFLVRDPHVSEGLSVDGMRWAFSLENAYTFTGGPLTWLSHMLDFELFGAEPGPHHVINLLLHVLNTVLLFALLVQLTGATGRSACVAALFAVHPLHVESVAWISERKDVLSTSFWFLTTAAYVRYVRVPTAAKYAVVLFLLMLGLLAKPVLATLPLTLLLLDAWPLGRAPMSLPEWRRWLPLWREKLLLFVPVAAVTILTMMAQQRLGAVTALPFSTRVLNAAVSYVMYLVKTFWPVNLAVFYPYPAEVPWTMVAMAIGVLGAVATVALRSVRARPWIAVGVAWYILTLIPMIGLVQVGSHSMADRYTYISLIGVFIAIAWTCADRVLAVLGVAAIVLCAVTARAQVATWQNSETMWRHALAVTKDNFRAHAGLAGVAAERGEIDAAIDHYRDAVRLAPDAAEWHANLGVLLSRTERFAEAASAFTRAVDLKPNDAESHNNLGAMLVRLGRTSEATAHYRRALEIRPAYALAHRNLGLALASQGDVTAGIQECFEALRWSPSEAQWHFEVAAMLASLGRTAEARQHLNETLRLMPQHQAAREMLAAIDK